MGGVGHHSAHYSTQGIVWVDLNAGQLDAKALAKCCLCLHAENGIYQRIPCSRAYRDKIESPGGTGNSGKVV